MMTTEKLFFSAGTLENLCQKNCLSIGSNGLKPLSYLVVHCRRKQLVGLPMTLSLNRDTITDARTDHIRGATPTPRRLNPV